VRGLAALDAVRQVDAMGRNPADVQPHLQRAAAEFARAVAFDSTFGEAWARLAQMEVGVADRLPSGPAKAAAAARARAALGQALARTPERPLTLLTLEYASRALDGDSTGQDTLVTRAVARGGNDPDVLRWVAAMRRDQGRVEESYALARRAAALDPRSPSGLQLVMDGAMVLGRWDEAQRSADALVALDSLDPRGWMRQLDFARWRGDTLALRRLVPLVAHHSDYASCG
jgi:hypothetical protein